MARYVYDPYIGTGLSNFIPDPTVIIPLYTAGVSGERAIRGFRDYNSKAHFNYLINKTMDSNLFQSLRTYVTRDNQEMEMSEMREHAYNTFQKATYVLRHHLDVPFKTSAIDDDDGFLDCNIYVKVSDAYYMQLSDDEIILRSQHYDELVSDGHIEAKAHESEHYF